MAVLVEPGRSSAQACQELRTRLEICGRSALEALLENCPSTCDCINLGSTLGNCARLGILPGAKHLVSLSSTNISKAAIWLTRFVFVLRFFQPPRAKLKYSFLKACLECQFPRTPRFQG